MPRECPGCYFLLGNGEKGEKGGCMVHNPGYDFNDASSMEQLRHATIPVLFVHGDADTFVSPRFLDMNFNACSSLDREKLLVPGADHVMGSVVAPDVYWRKIERFVRRTFRL